MTIETNQPASFLLPEEFKNIATHIKNNNVAVIKDLISQTKAIRGWEWGRSFELIIRDAVLAGKIDIVREILDAGFNVHTPIHEATNQESNRPLMYFAAQNADTNIMQLLYARSPRGDSLRKAMQCAFGKAVDINNNIMLDYLLKQGVSPNTYIRSSYPIYFANYALLIAAANNNISMVNSLMRAGACIGPAIRNIFFITFSRASEDNYSQLADAVWRAVKILLDYAQGMDLGDYDWRCNKFSEMPPTDVSGFNFMGVSFQGNPITREMLKAWGHLGTGNAIITKNDLLRCNDENRRSNLCARLELAAKKLSVTIEDDQVINLVPFYVAVANHDITLVKKRLQDGFDVNDINFDDGAIPSYSFSALGEWSTENYGCRRQPAIVYAAARLDTEMVKLLLKVPNVSLSSIQTAIKWLGHQYSDSHDKRAAPMRSLLAASLDKLKKVNPNNLFAEKQNEPAREPIQKEKKSWLSCFGC